jgi:hypothetical protein
VCRKLFAFWKEELISCIYANCVLISTSTCAIAITFVGFTVGDKVGVSVLKQAAIRAHALFQ